jgi:hypothetical protein
MRPEEEMPLTTARRFPAANTQNVVQLAIKMKRSGSTTKIFSRIDNNQRNDVKPMSFNE